MEDKHHSNHFFHGFILGAIVGAAVIFFLFTDKGKKLMKIISEEGMEGIGEIRDIIEAEGEEEESDEVMDQPAPKASPKSPKRFFKGIKRSTNN